MAWSSDFVAPASWPSLYDCQYVATNTWVVIGYTKLGAVQAALVPDAL